MSCWFRTTFSMGASKKSRMDHRIFFAVYIISNYSRYGWNYGFLFNSITFVLIYIIRSTDVWTPMPIPLTKWLSFICVILIDKCFNCHKSWRDKCAMMRKQYSVCLRTVISLTITVQFGFKWWGGVLFAPTWNKTKWFVSHCMNKKIQ